MEQLTLGEWVRSQLKRAPSFALASAITAILLLICATIEYAPASEPPPTLPPVRAEVEQEMRQQLEEIDRNIDPEEPELEQTDEMVEEPVESTVDTETDVVDDDFHVEADFVEDDSMVTQPTDPVPAEFTEQLAAISIDSGSGGFRGELSQIRSPAGRRRMARRAGMHAGTDEAILAGLRWLKNAQNPETGGWDAQRWGGSRSHSGGVSGLALLAFLGYGCTDLPRGELAEFAPTVVKAIEYLIDRQEQSPDSDRLGWFGGRLYTQGIVTMALAEASVMVQNRYLRERAREAAQLGLDYILRLQPEHGAFSYTGPGRDMSVTGFQLQALKAALTAELDVPSEALARAERVLAISMTGRGSTPYRIDPELSQQRGSGKFSMSAVTLTCRLWLGQSRRSEAAQRQAEYLTRNDQHLSQASDPSNLYIIYYTSLAMYNMGGRYWHDWNEVFNEALREAQVKDGPDAGSWDPGIHSGGGARSGGRVYTTAMALMSLQVYFRYLPTYQALDAF